MHGTACQSHTSATVEIVSLCCPRRRLFARCGARNLDKKLTILWGNQGRVRRLIERLRHFKIQRVREVQDQLDIAQLLDIGTAARRSAEAVGRPEERDQGGRVRLEGWAIIGRTPEYLQEVVLPVVESTPEGFLRAQLG